MLEDNVKNGSWFEINERDSMTLLIYISDLQQRIDKAIKYLEIEYKKQGLTETFIIGKFINKIKEILRGEDND